MRPADILTSMLVFNEGDIGKAEKWYAISDYRGS
jgi:hypothetical protein